MSSAIASLHSGAGGLGKRLIYDSLKVIYALSRAERQSPPPCTHTPSLLKVLRLIHRRPPKKKKKEKSKGASPRSPPTASAATIITQPVIKVICIQHDPELHMPSRIFQPAAILQSRAKFFIRKILPRHCIPWALAQEPGAGDSSGRGCDPAGFKY